jgi:hypothetical protein
MGKTTKYSWSHSRSSALAECPRRAFYDFYGSGEPEGDHIWRLKELSTVQMWAGSAVDYIINTALADYRKTGELRSGLSTFGSRHFKKGLARSHEIVDIIRGRQRNKREKDAEPFKPLQHHYYRFDLGDAYYDALDERVRTCLNNFETSEILERIQKLGPTDWGLATPPGTEVPSFKMRGHKIYSAYDFWLKESDDLHILDWKTGWAGEMSQASAARQLSIYALYGAYELKHPLEHIHTQAVWLQDAVSWQPQQQSRNHLETARDGILEEISKEHSMLEIKELKRKTEYYADRSAFPARPSAQGCLNCKFREICPEGSEACSHV